MKKPQINLTALSLILLLTLGFNAAFGSGVDSPTNCLPPQIVVVGQIQGDPVYLSQFHATYPNGSAIYDLTQAQHLEFDTLSCDPPPPNVGSFTTHSKNSRVKATLALQGGSSVQVDAPAIMTVKVTKTAGANPQTGTYQTEMLSLNISGGNLPPGVLIRESPTMASTGSTTISQNGNGTYHIDSFFDIFTELSTDGGQTWSASSTGAVHMALSNPPSLSIPTLNQWGLIIFSLLMLTVIMVFVRKGRMA